MHQTKREQHIDHDDHRTDARPHADDQQQRCDAFADADAVSQQRRQPRLGDDLKDVAGSKEGRRLKNGGRFTF